MPTLAPSNKGAPPPQPEQPPQPDVSLLPQPQLPSSVSLPQPQPQPQLSFSVSAVPQFCSSYDRGEPLEFTCGAGMMILGFDKAVADMNVGDIIDIHLMPEEAYGEKNPDAIITVPISELAGSEELKVDDMVYLQNVYGQPFPAMVTALTENDITFDANHQCF